VGWGKGRVEMDTEEEAENASVDENLGFYV
jgi:hypothetical protein